MISRKNILTCLLFAGSFLQLQGAFVEYYSGDISYKHVSGNCVSGIYYEFTLSLITTKKTAGDSVVIYYGDGDSSYIKRIDSVNIGNGLIKSTYRRVHVYSSCGNYSVYYFDTKNKQFAKNSNNQDFYLQSIIYADPLYPANNSLSDYNSPALHIFKNKPFKFNSTSSANNTFTYDSTVYSLYTPGIGGYFPSGITINKYTGEIKWQNPDTLASYSIGVSSKTYKYGLTRSSKTTYLKFKIVTPVPSFVWDSLSTLPVNTNGYFEFSYNSGTTYTFCAKYKDPSADSVRIFVYPIDFFNTPLQYTYSINSSRNHFINASWSPLSIDIRDYHYNLVLNAISYYGPDSVSNSYQTISYRYVNSTIGIKETLKENKSITVFPNPSSEILSISLNEDLKKEAEIEIINTFGQSVLKLSYKDQVDISSIPPGYYILKLTKREKKALISKFVKE